MTLNRSMVSLTTRLMVYVIKFKPKQLSMSHSGTHKCFKKLIIQNSLKQWRLKSAITRIIVTGISCCKKDLPLGAKSIMAIWLFKRKQFPDRMLNKHKAQLCAHGGQQTWGQDYWDTHAPVITWASVDFCLLSPRFMVLNQKASTLFLHFLRQI